MTLRGYGFCLLQRVASFFFIDDGFIITISAPTPSHGAWPIFPSTDFAAARCAMLIAYGADIDMFDGCLHRCNGYRHAVIISYFDSDDISCSARAIDYFLKAVSLPVVKAASLPRVKGRWGKCATSPFIAYRLFSPEFEPPPPLA